MTTLTIIVSVCISVLLVKSMVGKNRNGARFYQLDLREAKRAYGEKVEDRMSKLRKYASLAYMIFIYVIKILFVVLIAATVVGKIISWFR